MSAAPGEGIACSKIVYFSPHYTTSSDKTLLPIGLIQMISLDHRVHNKMQYFMLVLLVCRWYFTFTGDPAGL